MNHSTSTYNIDQEQGRSQACDKEQGKGQAFSQEVVEAFASLFKGRTDAWGSLSAPKGECNYGTVTLKHHKREEVMCH